METGQQTVCSCIPIAIDSLDNQRKDVVRSVLKGTDEKLELLEGNTREQP